MVIHHHPKIILNLAGFEVLTWDLFFILSIILTGALLLYYAKKNKNLNVDTMFKLHLFSLILIVIFGWAVPKILDYNMSSLRGILVFCVGMFLFIKWKNISFKYLDVYVLFALIGFAIGRIGCFINWCCFGILTDLPWGIQVWDYLPVHPTQIYEIIFVLILFGLFFNYRNTSFLKKIGNTSLSIIASYSLFRALIIEPLRYGIGTEDGFLRITLLLAIFLSAALILALRNDLFTKLKNYIFLIKVKKAV